MQDLVSRWRGSLHRRASPHPTMEVKRQCPRIAIMENPSRAALRRARAALLVVAAAQRTMSEAE